MRPQLRPLQRLLLGLCASAAWPARLRSSHLLAAPRRSADAHGAGSPRAEATWLRGGGGQATARPPILPMAAMQSAEWLTELDGASEAAPSPRWPLRPRTVKLRAQASASWSRGGNEAAAWNGQFLPFRMIVTSRMTLLQSRPEHDGSKPFVGIQAPPPQPHVSSMIAVRALDLLRQQTPRGHGTSTAALLGLGFLPLSHTPMKV